MRSQVAASARGGAGEAWLTVFTTEERERVREHLLALARADERVVAGAITGSSAKDAEDPWSDVDVAFAVAEGVDPDEVMDEWTSLLDGEFGVLHHWDLRAGSLLYRVFLLPDCLEVDIGLAPAAEFGARGPGFRLLFGESAEGLSASQPVPRELIGLGWHHVLHAQKAIERGEPWQAEFYIGAIRDRALELACLRFGEPADYARGIDRLPRDVTDPWKDALARSLEPDELRRALVVVTAEFIRELRETDPAVADRLEPQLRERASQPLS